MSFKEIFPAGVRELILSYLSLPELLVCEHLDKEITEILKASHFWRRRIEEEYSSEDLTESKDLRSRYRSLFMKEIIDNGKLFELGQTGFSLTEEDKSLIRDCKYLGMDDFEFGAYLEGHGMPEISRKNMIIIGALHYGDILDISEYKDKMENQWNKINILKTLKFYSKDMIDNTIKTQFATPNEIFLSLIFHVTHSPKQISLLEYLLENRHKEIPDIAGTALSPYRMVDRRGNFAYMEEAREILFKYTNMNSVEEEDQD